MAYANGTLAAAEWGWSQAAEWIRERWDMFVGLEPQILDLQHRAAVARGAALQRGDDATASLARELIEDLGELSLLHGRIVDRMRELGGYIGLGAIAVPVVLITAFAVVAAGMAYLMARLDIQRRLVAGLEAGTLTRADLAELEEAGDKPEGLLGPAVSLGKLALWGFLAWVALQAVREWRNPRLEVWEANPPGGRELIGERVYQVRYRHAEDRRPYYHDFGRDVELWGEPDGTVTLRHRRGRDLWRDF